MVQPSPWQYTGAWAGGRSAGTPGSMDQDFGYRGPTRVLDQENWGNMGFGSRFNQAQDIRELVWELPQLLVSTTRFLVQGFKLRCGGGERRCWGTRTCIGNGEVPSNIQHPYHREGWEVSSIQYPVSSGPLHYRRPYVFLG